MKKLDPEKVRYIIIHCSDTTCNSSVTTDTIEYWHKKRGFETIGYHYLVLPSGHVSIGRDLAFQGAHCLGYNDRSIGVCYVGGVDSFGCHKDTRTFAQKIGMANLFLELIKLFPSITQIIGHNDCSTKVCPCFDAKFEYRDFISKVKPCLTL